MRQPSFRLLALFPVILIIALAACQPSAPGTASAPTAAVPFIGQAVPDDTTSPNESTVVATPEVATAVATASGETDANGIPVGFTEDGHAYRGRPDAPVRMEVFSDFQCPFCGRFSEETLPTLLENQIAGGDTVFIFYDFAPRAPRRSQGRRGGGQRRTLRRGGWSGGLLGHARPAVCRHRRVGQ